MTTFKPRLEILPPQQRKIWPGLKAVSDAGFVLYGGTAIALYLGHRESVDFDFFTDQPLPRNLAGKIPLLRKAKLLVEEADTLTYQVAPLPDRPPVKLSFFGDIPFANKGRIKSTGDGVLRVAPLSFLMATKLKVLLQRVEPRDYIDIAALLEVGLLLQNGLKIAGRLFGPHFQPNEAKKALVYFAPSDLRGLSPSVKATLVAAVRGLNGKQKT